MGTSSFWVPLGISVLGGTGSPCQSVSSFSSSFLQLSSPVVWGSALSIAASVSHPHQPESKGKWGLLTEEWQPVASLLGLAPSGARMRMTEPVRRLMNVYPPLPTSIATLEKHLGWGEYSRK